MRSASSTADLKPSSSGLTQWLRIQVFEVVVLGQRPHPEFGVLQGCLALAGEPDAPFESLERILEPEIAGLHLLDQGFELLERCFEVDFGVRWNQSCGGLSVSLPCRASQSTHIRQAVGIGGRSSRCRSAASRRFPESVRSAIPVPERGTPRGPARHPWAGCAPAAQSRHRRVERRACPPSDEFAKDSVDGLGTFALDAQGDFPPEVKAGSFTKMRLFPPGPGLLVGGQVGGQLLDERRIVVGSIQRLPLHGDGILEPVHLGIGRRQCVQVGGLPVQRYRLLRMPERLLPIPESLESGTWLAARRIRSAPGRCRFVLLPIAPSCAASASRPLPANRYKQAQQGIGVPGCAALRVPRFGHTAMSTGTSRPAS